MLKSGRLTRCDLGHRSAAGGCWNNLNEGSCWLGSLEVVLTQFSDGLDEVYEREEAGLPQDFGSMALPLTELGRSMSGADFWELWRMNREFDFGHISLRYLLDL